MTTPNQPLPGDAIGGGDVSALNGLSEATWRANQLSQIEGYDQAHDNFNVPGILQNILNLFSRSDDQDLIINDHSQQITEVVAAVDRMILQGQSEYYASNNRHYISPGVTSIDFILLGGGAGGSHGVWDFLVSGQRGGAGGGGGGEIHLNVPRSLLGAYVDIVAGPGGQGARSNRGAGGGGGDTKIITPDGTLVAGGGQGGRGGPDAVGFVASGGTGMIPGGTGGGGAGNTWSGTNGGASFSSFELYGGGGGGGGGGTTSGSGDAGNGGQGGITRGGRPNQPGGEPAGIVATGGGGAGGGNEMREAPPGGYPSGGGGGAHGTAKAVNGGDGAAGGVFVIERIA